MGITVNNDIVQLQKKIIALEAQLKELQTIVFEDAILSEPEDTWDVIRAKRDYILKTTDWTMIPGSSVDQGAWSAYRQVLRDLPQTQSRLKPEDIAWPRRPSTSGPNTIEQ